ncbi:hypothetical protein CY34DRAFT_106848 [Suillus luteus UH-Slu-Lm8-n1]|uniref:Uncharacterized protein n=1 Tax=Suillus luteus UH-Slu-Lm8-n1 TaxID=930992 RepID=A0A0D0BH69_9AGAM|nr:hypothetical protein CY34DRAFT_106848 [Suillus luteus UH-Slu-Lm8-n1]
MSRFHQADTNEEYQKDSVTIAVICNWYIGKLKRYINHLEMLRDEQCDQLRDIRQTHAQELEMECDHIEELQATIRFQSNILEYMVEDVEKLQDENKHLRVENQDIIEENLQDNTKCISACLLEDYKRGEGQTVGLYVHWRIKVKMTWPMAIINLSLKSMKDNYLTSTITLEAQNHYQFHSENHCLCYQIQETCDYNAVLPL